MRVEWTGEEEEEELFGWRWWVPQNDREKSFKNQNMKKHMEKLEASIVCKNKKVQNVT